MNKKGFTLIELIVVLAIMGIVSGMIFGILDNGMKINDHVTNMTNIQNEARTAIVTISDDVRKGTDFLDGLNAASPIIPDGSSTDLTQGDLLTVDGVACTPIIYIKKLDGMCIYVVKGSSSPYSLYKINLSAADTSYYYMNDLTDSSAFTNADYDHIKNNIKSLDTIEAYYYFKNYLIQDQSDFDSHVIKMVNAPTNYSFNIDNLIGVNTKTFGYKDTGSNIISLNMYDGFYYYQGSRIFRCFFDTSADPANLDTYNPFKSIELKKQPFTIVKSNIVPICSDLTGIPEVISQNNGKSYKISLECASGSYKKSLSTIVSKSNFGGDSDEDE